MENNEIKSTDILIIGAGTAGLSAALFGARAGRKVTVIENNVHGGQIINSARVENFPSIEEISGADFAQNLYRQVKNKGAEILYRKIIRLVLEGREKEAVFDGLTLRAKTVILATGAYNRGLGCPGEEKFKGRGVYFCSTCDGAFYRDKTVIVGGGAASAVRDALFLANLCSKVYLLKKGDTESECETVNGGRRNIEPIYNSEISEFLGENTLSAVTLRDLKTGESRRLEVDGAFISAGRSPQTSLFADIINRDENGYIIAGEDCLTNVEGVWCAGDCRRKPLRQLITAAADGAVAAAAAAAYAETLKL